ncbi:hypothetical protein [Lacimicrobium alkaliphilum]|uniref:Phage abortive infection protein n=1 Tax=Lacimicrobium alkaliphilum TaxID=1526571 RepID=A0A0U2Z1P7_9ALTE|nr:hypothetical protein [Lacimicrobium alkaliphilum]ALS96819.1 hypothetical protein AT746_00030 [Lacimicrobium alkaliphilum]
MHTSKKNKLPMFFIVLGAIVTLAGVAIFLVVLMYSLTFQELSENHERFAQFGDYFGGILNPILSFLTIVLLVGSLALQRVELSKVVEELELTRRVHLSSVNMKHWEHILETFDKGESDVLVSSNTFKDILDSKISLEDVGKNSQHEKKMFSVYEIFANEELLREALSNGYWTARADVSQAYIQHRRPFTDITGRLDANLKLLTAEIVQLRDLGCPRHRAKHILQVGIDLLQDYFFSESVPPTFKLNISLHLSEFEAFKVAYLEYPDNL